MSLSNTIKQNKIKAIVILALLIIIAIISFVLWGPKEKKYTFKTKETNFSVAVPNGWTVTEEPRLPGGEGFEPSPDEGIKLVLNGNQDNYIWIYSQYGSINIPEDEYEQEDFTTNKGIKGILYKEKGNQGNWQLVLNQDITSDSYGAVISFTDIELLNKNKEQIMNILKSIDINKP